MSTTACDVGGICPNGEQMASELNSAGVVVDDVILDNRHQRVEFVHRFVRHRPEGAGGINGQY